MGNMFASAVPRSRSRPARTSYRSSGRDWMSACFQKCGFWVLSDSGGSPRSEPFYRAISLTPWRFSWQLARPGPKSPECSARPAGALGMSKEPHPNQHRLILAGLGRIPTMLRLRRHIFGTILGTFLELFWIFFWNYFGTLLEFRWSQVPKNSSEKVPK